MGDESGDRGAVVVPAITAPSSLACLRSLRRAGAETVVAYEDPTTPAIRSNYCDEAVPVPAPTEDLAGYRDALLSLAERPSVRTILPVREADVYVLSKYRDRFEPHVGTVWPTLDVLRDAQDRVRLFGAARRAGVPVPETRPADEWDDWSRETIVKSRYNLLAEEYVGPGVTGIDTGRGTTRYVPAGERPDLAALERELGHVPIAQDYVPGDSEYGFFALYDHGEAVATFQHRQIRGYKYSGGPSAYRRSTSIPELESAGRALLDELDWHGVAMAEFLHDDEADEFRLMEVNPRFWSSLPFTVQAGVEFPAMCLAQATGTLEHPDDDYAVGIGGHLLRGEALYLHSVFTESYPLVERPSRPGAIRSVLGSLVRDPRFDYLDLRDPGPFLRDALNLVGGAVPSIGGDDRDDRDEESGSGRPDLELTTSGSEE